MTYTIDIQPVEDWQLDTLCALAERTFRDAWQANNEPAAFETYCREHFTPEQLRTEMLAEHSRFFLAWKDAEAIAYLKLNYHQPNELLPPSTDALQLERIYVSQGFKGQGIGEQLLHYTETLARKSGSSCVWLSVWQKAPRSVAFYEKNGYEIFGTETFWLADDPQTDWLMKKEMSPTDAGG